MFQAAQQELESSAEVAGRAHQAARLDAKLLEVEEEDAEEGGKIVGDILGELLATVVGEDRTGSCESGTQEKEAEKEGLKGMDKRASLLQWFAATAEAKLKAVQGYIKDLLSSDKKFLVFCHHQTMLNGIESMLEKEGVGFIKIEGKVSSEARKTSVDR